MNFCATLQGTVTAMPRRTDTDLEKNKDKSSEILGPFVGDTVARGIATLVGPQFAVAKEISRILS